MAREYCPDCGVIKGAPARVLRRSLREGATPGSQIECANFLSRICYAWPASGTSSRYTGPWEVDRGRARLSSRCALVSTGTEPSWKPKPQRTKRNVSTLASIESDTVRMIVPLTLPYLGILLCCIQCSHGGAMMFVSYIGNHSGWLCHRGAPARTALPPRVPRNGLLLFPVD